MHTDLTETCHIMRFFSHSRFSLSLWSISASFASTNSSSTTALLCWYIEHWAFLWDSLASFNTLSLLRILNLFDSFREFSTNFMINALSLVKWSPHEMTLINGQLIDSDWSSRSMKICARICSWDIFTFVYRCMCYSTISGLWNIVCLFPTSRIRVINYFHELLFIYCCWNRLHKVTILLVLRWFACGSIELLFRATLFWVSWRRDYWLKMMGCLTKCFWGWLSRYWYWTTATKIEIVTVENEVIRHCNRINFNLQLSINYLTVYY